MNNLMIFLACVLLLGGLIECCENLSVTNSVAFFAGVLFVALHFFPITG